MLLFADDTNVRRKVVDSRDEALLQFAAGFSWSQ